MLLNLLIAPIAFFCCDRNVWNGITPLKSTKAEIVAKFGAPMEKRDDTEYRYKHEGGGVAFRFARGCAGEHADYDLPTDRVVMIAVRPKPRTLISSFKIDLPKFEFGKANWAHPPAYSNRDVGVTVWLRNDEVTVYRVDYFGGNGSGKSLCPKNLPSD